MTIRAIHWSRRAVSAMIAGALAWPLGSTASSSTQAPLRQILLSLFENPEHACSVGEICLDSFSRNGPSLHLLETKILAAANQDSTNAVVQKQITGWIVEDFANGVVVNIDGWQLSLTEAQLYALVAVNFPRAA